jgi:DNA-binding MarR family transcriptional regulator/ribosomal protein S18 acetylase RimI-like enzyme
MRDPAVEQVRSFNRAVTERIGALDEHYLGRGRPLGQARMLWEIGYDGADVRDLRRRLGIDSGYASRLLRALEAEGLVEVGTGTTDRRVRRARLTMAGRTERGHLDRLSDEQAASILEPLDDTQRARLQTAMAEVELLLRASQIEIAVEDPASDDAHWCVQQYFDELAERFEGGFDPAKAIQLSVDELTPPAGLMLVARLRGRPVGCGSLRSHGLEPTHLKRMWIARDIRGAGLGRRLLRELERHAVEVLGASAVQLETNRSLTEAIALYRASGYAEVPRFNDEIYGDHWFAKRLAPD